MNFRQRCQLMRELSWGKDSLFNEWSGHEVGEKNEPNASTLLTLFTKIN